MQLLRLLLFLLLCCNTLFLSAQDTAQFNTDTLQQATANATPGALEADPGTDYGLFLFCIIIILGILVVVGAGFAMAVFALVALFILISMGFISTGILIGSRTQSWQKAIRFIVIGLSAITGCFAALVSGFIYLSLLDVQSRTDDMILIGLLGLAGGAGLGQLCFLALNRLYLYFQQRL